MRAEQTKRVLVQWLDVQDVAKLTHVLERRQRQQVLDDLSLPSTEANHSPLLTLLAHHAFDELILLNPYCASWQTWLQVQLPARTEIRHVPLAPQADIATIWHQAERELSSIEQTSTGPFELSLNLSAGTREMTAVWVLLSQVRYQASLYQVSETHCTAITLPNLIGHQEGLHPLGNGFDLEEHLTHLRRHYLQRAMVEARGIKAKAAKLLGMRHYQTLSAQLVRLAVQDTVSPRHPPPSGERAGTKS